MVVSRKSDIKAVTPNLTELLPTPEMRMAFDDASAAIEAGLLVRSMRGAASLSQAALATRLGVSQARVSAIEKGDGRDGPSYALLRRIAAACGATWPFQVTASKQSETLVVSTPKRKFWRRPLKNPYESVPLDRSSSRKIMIVVDAGGRTVAEVKGVVVERKRGVALAGVHFDQHKSSFVSGASNEERPKLGFRKLGNREG